MDIDQDILREARRRVETTAEPQAAIAAELGIPRRRLSELKRHNGWSRPHGAPVAVPGRRPGKRGGRGLVARLYRAFEEQLAGVEARLAAPGTVIEEKDARTLGSLARTLETLMSLEKRDTGAKKPTEPTDIDQLRAELARRIDRWAAGGTGSAPASEEPAA
jgi:hypothetical protein